MKSIFLLAILFAVPVLAEQAADFEYGPRPAMHVFDPEETLEPAWIKKVADPLAESLKKDGVDVFVVVLKNMENAPPEHIARQFSAAWCESPIHCIVLHVPGQTNSPWIFPMGRLVDLLDSSTVEKDVANAQRRARSEPDDAHRVMAAAQEASDMIRYWMGGAILRSETIQTESNRIRLEQELISRQKQIALLGGLAAIIPLIAGIAVVVNVVRNHHPRHFPNHLWQLRLGAPHTGGNHAVANLGPIPPRP